MLNPAPPADDLAMAMKERKKLTFVALSPPAWPPPYPRTQRAQRDLAVAAQDGRAQCYESCKMERQELRQSNIALAFQLSAARTGSELSAPRAQLNQPTPGSGPLGGGEPIFVPALSLLLGYCY